MIITHIEATGTPTPIINTIKHPIHIILYFCINTSFMKRFFILMILPIFLFSQNPKKIDSLLKLLKTARHETTRFNTYLELGDEWHNANPDTALYFHAQAEKIAEKIPGPDGELQKGEAIRKKGWDYFVKSNYTTALLQYESALKVALEHNSSSDKNIKARAQKLLSATWGNIGVVYTHQGDNPKALEYFFRALKLDEELGNKNGVAWLLGNIGVVYSNQGDYPKALEFYFRALKLDEELGNKNSIAGHLGNIGIVYFNQGDYQKAMNYYLRTYKIFEEIGDKKGQADNLGNIGIVYYNQGDYPKALEYYFRALKMYEEIGNKLGESDNLRNIGDVYANLKDYSKAMEHYLRALKIKEEIGDKMGQADNLRNIGIVYCSKGDYSRGLEYYLRALKINEEVGYKMGEADNLGNIGFVYMQQGDSASRTGNTRLAAEKYSRAMEHYLRALKIKEEIGDKIGQAINLGNIGALYLKQKKYSSAETYMKKAVKLNKEVGAIYFLLEDYLNLSELCYQTGRYKLAYEYYKKHIKYRDSVISEENQKAAILKEMQYNFDKEQALKEKEHQKKLELERKEKEKQRIITGFVLSGLVLVIAFLGFVINRLNVTRKQKNIIEEQKRIVEEQKLLVEDQKKMVEQRNKDILDSINYAKRIQNAILPSSAFWKEHLPDSFVLYLPKEIVAGDFYWMEYENNYVYVAAADCTGHGVPGAMVSVVCSNALTKAVLEDKLTETDQILNRTRELVIEKLTSEDNIRDGMDICLIRIEKGKNAIQFSGANRSLYLVNHDKSLTEIKPDKQPIGRYEESKPFARQDIELKENIWLYLTTDGYADQFGGENGKKIGTKQFKGLLCDIAVIEHPEEQKEKLSFFFKEWKGNEEQMDDVTIIGLKI
ncbi:MAG: tetratricopeptide repeat protein [Bacteroidia bacterium]|nr:tetratricopeptide repeat protein [Bacteroidia bacterium]